MTFSTETIMYNCKRDKSFRFFLHLRYVKYFIKILEYIDLI